MRSSIDLNWIINTRSSNSLTRRVLNDFPGRELVIKHTSVIDTRHLSQRGGKHVCCSLLEEIDKPIVIDWRWKYVQTLNRLTNDHRCRLIMAESIDLDIPFKLTSTGVNGKFNLEMAGESIFQSQFL